MTSEGVNQDFVMVGDPGLLKDGSEWVDWQGVKKRMAGAIQGVAFIRCQKPGPQGTVEDPVTRGSEPVGYPGKMT